MKQTKNNIGAIIAAILFILFVSPLLGEKAPDFLKGKVHLLDKSNLSLAQKFAQAEKEFKKSKSGDTYFTGYIFLSRFGVQMGEKFSSEEPYRATVKNDEIKLRKVSKWRKNKGESFSTEDGSEPAGILFLHRISKNKAKILDARIIDLDQTFEFQEVPIYWLGEADNNESLRFLEEKFNSGGSDLQKTLVFVFSSHDSPKVCDFLRQVALGDYRKEVRKNAIFWLGGHKNTKSLKYLKEIYNKEENTELKKQVVFAIQLSDQKEAVVELIKIAKTDLSQKVRKNAIFWLGQKASKESLRALKEVVEESEDVDIKKSAVFAISQLPEDKSVPMLIDIAKSNKNPSVRKNAIFWLGQVGGEKALKFFEEILLKK
ncbi:MAG: HEAT repeat domain-containing protein [Candidatus Aminicenantes bacterium]|nr:HEAT repeat domain-containing protein [Candidatus Aminicenantes bacterium]